MRMDQMTSKLQAALSDAQSLAVGNDNNFIEPVHLILALLDQKGGSVRQLLSQTGFAITDLRTGLQQIMERLPKVQGNGGDVAPSNELGRLLNMADKHAQQKGDKFIASEAIILAAMNDKGELGKLLTSFGVSEKALENAISNLRGGDTVSDAGAEESRQALMRFCVDLTERAEKGEPWWGVFVVVLLGVLLGLTIWRAPWFTEDDSARDVQVAVTGMQFGFLVQPTTVKVGQHVQFNVTSKDVNHAMALYNPKGQMIMNVQSIPGYTVSRSHTFNEPGTYEMRCLEFCGYQHHKMIYPAFQVTA
jgi:plastocyanin/lambda repressor-like predicted transcriptional regulator